MVIPEEGTLAADIGLLDGATDDPAAHMLDGYNLLTQGEVERKFLLLFSKLKRFVGY